jgi:hypothetical protein
MKIIGKILLSACLVSVTGCMGAIMGSQLTTDQLQALRDYNGDVYACGVLGGPPPIGNVIFIVVPKGSVMDLTFPPSCPIIVKNKER